MLRVRPCALPVHCSLRCGAPQSSGDELVNVRRADGLNDLRDWSSGHWEDIRMPRTGRVPGRARALLQLDDAEAKPAWVAPRSGAIIHMITRHAPCGNRA